MASPGHNESMIVKGIGKKRFHTDQSEVCLLMAWHRHVMRHPYGQGLNLGLYSLSGWPSYRKVSWSPEAARFGFRLFQSLWNFTGISAAVLPRCLYNFRVIQPLHQISRLQDFTRFDGKTSYHLVNRGPGSCVYTRLALEGLTHWGQAMNIFIS